MAIKLSMQEAKQVLLRDTLEDGGTFLRLRLGEDPGRDAIKRLRLALRTLWRHYLSEGAIPREIVLGCAMVIHFSTECYANLRANEKLERDLQQQVEDLVQGAFDVLAGEHAMAWIVRRPDLGEVS